MNKAIELKHLLDKLDVPEGRKDDYGWLIRNLPIRNKGEDAEKAVKIAKELWK